MKKRIFLAIEALSLTPNPKNSGQQKKLQQKHFFFIKIMSKKKIMFHGEWHPLHVFGDDTPCDGCRLDCRQNSFADIGKCDDTAPEYMKCVYNAKAQEYNCELKCFRAGVCDQQFDMIPPPPRNCYECTQRVDNQLAVCQSECDQMYQIGDLWNQECRSRCDELRAFNQVRCFEYGFCRR